MIIVSIASVKHPQRLKLLVEMLKSLERQTIVPDCICVSLEGYENISAELPNFKGVSYFIHPPLVGGISSYTHFDDFDNSICISLDDDLIIPDNFICEVSSRIGSTKDDICISYLSKIFTDIKEDTKYQDHYPIHFSDVIFCETRCHILGSGISAFRSEHIKGCFEFMQKICVPGIYRDMLVSHYLWLQGVSIIRPPSIKGFIKGADCSDNCNDKKSLQQRNEIFSILRLQGFLDPQKFGSRKGN